MPDYQKMYLSLFNKVSEIIELLQNAKRETEELYIESDDTTIMLPTDDESDTAGD